MSANDIRNKQVRSKVKTEMKKEKASAKREKRDKRKREVEELGKDAPAAQVPRTLESMREFDETVVAADDEEIIGEEAMDEYAEYFGGNGALPLIQSAPLVRAEVSSLANMHRALSSAAVPPKLMITTAKQPRPTKATYDFIKDFMGLFPHIFFYKRKGYEIKQICEIAASRGFTDLIVVSEDHKAVNSLWLIHLPGGPTAHFKLSSLKVRDCAKKLAGATIIVLNLCSAVPAVPFRSCAATSKVTAIRLGTDLSSF
jgi:ribosome production factor 1